MKKFKKILKYLLTILLIALFVGFLLGPKYIDKTKNTTTLTPTNIDKTKTANIPFMADLHCDALLWDRDLLKRNSHGHVDIPRMIEANMAFQVFTIVSKVPQGINIVKNQTDAPDQITALSILQLQPLSSWFSIKNRAIHQCDKLHEFAQKSEGKFRIITTKEELKTYVNDRKKNSKIAAGMLGIEGAQCLENDLKNIDILYKKGVRYIGLAHFFDNQWAGSAHGAQKYGLTPKGIELVKKMEKLNITIDLAHASAQTVKDVLRYTQKPLLVSHTGVKSVCNNERNLTDEQIIEIGKRNGLIGIGFWETAVCGTNAKATAQNIKYVADKIGIDKVALGSDWDGSIEAHFDVNGLPLMVEALENEGFTKTAIEKIMGGNVKDFFLKNLP